MAFRGNESPMDFQWQGYGPVDPTSPFHKLAMDNEKKRKTDPKSVFSSLNDTPGSHSQFNSPNKNSFPTLREANGQAYLFNNVPVKGSYPTFRQPSFTTPRKAFDLDFSSGPESSPVAQPEEEDTPDGKPLPPLPVEFKSKPEKRNSLFAFYGKYAPSSGRGEIRKPTSDAIVKRIHKRRRQGQTFERQLALAKQEVEYTSDDSDAVPDIRREKKKKEQKQVPVEEVGWLTSLFTFIHTYPDAPSIIAKYLQVFFNAVILFACLYMFYSFYATIRADVDKASEDAMQEILAEMTACSKNYMQNNCAPHTRLPALEQVCTNWELCMNRDPNAIKRARLSAHTFAEIFNSFVEPISLKTMLFTTLIVGLALVVNNATFTIYRKSQEHHHEGFRYGSSQYMASGQHPSEMGQYAVTPGTAYNQSQPQFWTPALGQGEQDRLGYEYSPTKDRGRSRSPEKKRLALEN